MTHITICVKDLRELAEKSRDEVIERCHKKRLKEIDRKLTELTDSYNFWKKWWILSRFSDKKPPTIKEVVEEVDDHRCTLAGKWASYTQEKRYDTALSILDLCELSWEETLEISIDDIDKLKGRR